MRNLLIAIACGSGGLAALIGEVSWGAIVGIYLLYVSSLFFTQFMAERE
jgi:hypothetical protein